MREGEKKRCEKEGDVTDGLRGEERETNSDQRTIYYQYEFSNSHQSTVDFKRFCFHFPLLILRTPPKACSYAQSQRKEEIVIKSLFL